jgi:hypothetical protein
MSEEKTWAINVNGRSNSQASGFDLVLTSPYGMELEYALRFNFKAINNEAKNKALIAGLSIVKELGV